MYVTNCVKGLRIFPYSVRMRENTDQKNGHFSRSHYNHDKKLELKFHGLC